MNPSHEDALPCPGCGTLAVRDEPCPVCGRAPPDDRIGQVIADDGKRGDTEIVPLSWIEDIARSGDRAAWKSGE